MTGTRYLRRTFCCGSERLTPIETSKSVVGYGPAAVVRLETYMCVHASVHGFGA